MPISDIYVGRANLFGSSTATTAVPILSLYANSTKRFWVVGVRVNIVTTTAAAGNNVLFQLCRSGVASTVTNIQTGSNGPTPHDQSAPASLGTIATTWSTPPTVGTVLWEQELPQTTGSSWEEFPPAGYEWGVPLGSGTGIATSGVHMFINQSILTATTYNVDLIWSE